MKGEAAQLDLFAAPVRRPAEPALAVALERERAAASAIAARLPAGIRFGTSSWGFPGWAGIVYSRRASPAELAREGLSEYARHPLLTTVGIDRSYYAPVPAADLRRYASQVPPGFPCCAKAPERVTAAVLRDGRPNPDFLSSAVFVEETVGPFFEHFAGHNGPFLLQFPPAPRAMRPDPRAFADGLERFLEALPRAARYAVELRDPDLLTSAYAAALARRGAAHVYNYVTAMPMPELQAERVPLETAPFAVVRLLLRPGTRYDERREEFEPFDRVVDPDPEMRRQVVGLARRSLALGREVSVLVNNKAEGSSPATIRALAEILADAPP